MKRRRAVDLVALGGSLVVLITGAWILPYRFPPSRFIAGASFAVGFNNVVAYLWFLGFLPVPVWFAARLLRGRLSGVRATFGRGWSPISWWLFGAAALAHVVLFGAVYAYKGRFVFAEALYFQTLLHRMTLGEVPYVHFSFYYGPSMLYPAHWLGKAMGLEAGYALWFVLTYVGGLGALYLLLRIMLPSGRSVAGWFAFLAVGLINPWTGLNVTFLRFLLPSIAFFVVADFLDRGGWARCVVASATLAFALMYSFEVAVLSTVALVVLVVVTVGERQVEWLRNGMRVLINGPAAGQMAADHPDGGPSSRLTIAFRGGNLLGVAALACVAVFFAIDPSGRTLAAYPETALSYSAGAHNLPLYPSLPFLAMAAFAVFAVAGAALVFTDTGLRGSRQLLIAYLMIVVLTQRGVFGVSEPTHFAFFGLPTVLLCLFLSSHLRNAATARRWMAAGVIVGMVFPLQYYHFTQLAPFFSHRAWVATATVPGAARGPALDGRSVEAALTEAVRTLGTDRPYVMYDLDYYSFPVYRQLRLRYPMYYTMLINARTHEGIERAIDEVRSAGAIVLIRKEDLDGVRPWTRAPRWRILDVLSAAHTAGSDLTITLLASKTNLVAPFLAFLRAEYRPIWQRDGIVALGPRPNEIVGSR